jgi:hypothetical protein
VPVELLVPAVAVVTLLVVAAVFVTGAPLPVSVAVVPVAVDFTVSDDSAVLSAGFPPPQALQRETMAMMPMILRSISKPPRQSGAIVAPGWRAT